MSVRELAPDEAARAAASLQEGVSDATRAMLEPFTSDGSVASSPEALLLGWLPESMRSGPIALAILAAMVLVASWIIGRVLFLVLSRLTRSDKRTLTRQLVLKTRRPVMLVIAGFGLNVLIHGVWARGTLSPDTFITLSMGVRVLLILSITWLVIAAISASDDFILARYRMDVRDNLRARRVHTQVRVISRTMQIGAAIIGLAIALMVFDPVAEIGASLLASAGLAGLAVGFAARPVLENLIAGIQIALTQPIRLDDVVIIDGEWGWIEEITTTYVVVKIWDQRRLIVPFSKVIAEPFQNWTRKTAELLGTVFIHADYTVDLEKMRKALRTACEADELWDGRVCLLQVTDSKDRTLELRALVSAADSPSAWDLRCHVREALAMHMRNEQPDALPRVRALVSEPDGMRSPGVRLRDPQGSNEEGDAE